MRIIDVHTHMGIDPRSGRIIDSEYLIQRMDKNQIEKSIVFSYPSWNAYENSYQRNLFVMEECKKAPERLIPYFLYCPNSHNNIIDLEHWKGVKLYPNHVHFFQNKEVYELMDEVCAKHLPVFIHSDMRTGVAEEIVNFLVKYPQCKFAICHSFHLDKESLYTIQRMENVYVDVSPWILMMRLSDLLLVKSEQLPEWYQENAYMDNFLNLYNIMKGRVLWGTDLSDDNEHSFQGEVRYFMTLPDEIRNQIYLNSMKIINMAK